MNSKVTWEMSDSPLGGSNLCQRDTYWITFHQGRKRTEINYVAEFIKINEKWIIDSIHLAKGKNKKNQEENKEGRSRK